MSHMSRAPLRLLIVTDRGTIPNWLYQCLAAVAGSNVATVVLAVRAAPTERRKRRRLLFSLYETIDRYLFRSIADALAPIDLRSALPTCRVVDLPHVVAGWQLVSTSLVRALEDEHIDVVLDPFCLLP